MNSIIKSSLVAFILSVSLQPAVHANNDDVIVDYCAHYADRVANGERFIDYPNAGLATNIANYVYTGGSYFSAAAVVTAFVFEKHQRIFLPSAFFSLVISSVAEEIAHHFSMLDLSFKRRAKCAALGLIPACHNVKKDTPAEASSEDL